MKTPPFKYLVPGVLAGLALAYTGFGFLAVPAIIKSQVTQFAASTERERWTEIIWRAIHARDEFGAVPRNGFQLRLDSEQNFQENYEGSSYYYWL